METKTNESGVFFAAQVREAIPSHLRHIKTKGDGLTYARIVQYVWRNGVIRERKTPIRATMIPRRFDHEYPADHGTHAVAAVRAGDRSDGDDADGRAC